MKAHQGFTLLAISGLVLILVMVILYASAKITYRLNTLMVLAGTIAWFGGILIANWLKDKGSK